MTPTAAHRPLVRGRLSTTSLAELLVFALERRLSGSFVFEAPAGARSALVVARGRVTKLRTAEPVEQLGHLLEERGLLDDARLVRALRLAREHGQRLGDTLVRLHELRPEALDAALREQLGRRLCWLGQLPAESAYGFFADVDYLADRAALDTDPLALIWRCLRSGPAALPRQEALLAGLGERPLVLRQSAALERLPMSPGERRWLEALRARPRPLAALLPSGGVERAQLERLIGALLVLRQVGVEPEPGSLVPASGNAAASTAPSAPASTAPSARVAHTLLPPQSAHLASPPRSAPPPSSTPPATHAPPAAAPVPRSSSTRPAGDRVEHALERASRLVREQTRAEGAAAAALAIEQARQHLEHEEYAAAERLARKAAEADPGNAEILALHAWLRMSIGELATPALAAQIVGMLDRAVRKAPESVPVRSYRAQVLERLGRDEEAFRDYRFVARHAPEQIDAVRKVRLHLMRTRNEQKSSGIFSKLFLR